MLPSPPPQKHQPPLNPVGRCFRRVVDFFIKEVDDPMAEKKAEALLIAASVIAAMNFQAGINPPGGVYQETSYVNGKMEHVAGQAIAAYTYPDDYRLFSMANTISFTFSMTTMFLFLSGLSLKRRIFSLLLMTSMFSTITATTYSYKLALNTTTPDHDPELNLGWHSVNRLLKGALTTWYVIAGVTIVISVGKLVKPPLIAAYHRATLKT